MKFNFISTLVFFQLLLFNCSTKNVEVIVEIPSPTSVMSSEPNLHKAKDGTIYLSWIEPSTDGTSALKFSTLTEEGIWSDPKPIAQGSDWFVNWADFPSMTAFGEQNLAAHYLEKSATGTYTYDVKMIFSHDQGNHWNQPITPHTDNTNSEHGFVSKLELNGGTLLAVWLDGRKYAYAEENDSISKEMTLRGAVFNSEGQMLKEYLIDDRVCDCCQTDLAMTKKGPIVIYRNRSETEVRDIYYSHLIDEVWTEPKPIYDDQWTIAACPVNGAAIDVLGNKIVVLWYSMEENTPMVKLTFSNDHGVNFESPIVLSRGKTIGRVDVAFLEDGTALAVWVDTVEVETVIQMQRFDVNGPLSKPLVLAKTSEDRSSGFPRMVVKDDIAYLTYTLSGKELSIKTLAINIKELESIE